MKKYTIISLFAIIIGITYFVVRANAMPQGAKHELMTIHYQTNNNGSLAISTSDGKFETITISKVKDLNDQSQALIKLQEYENMGWILKSASSGYFISYRDNYFYDYVLER